MDRVALWQRYKKHLCVCPSLGLSLDISRMDFPDDFFAWMHGPMQRAYEAMAALEAGEVANPDEKRMVGHYWLRAPQMAPDPQIRQQIEKALADVKAFAAAVYGKKLVPPGAPKFTDVLLIGIGGSALGPQLVADALGNPGSKRDRMKLHFMDNTDPDGIERTLGQIGARLKSTLVVVVSKSGGTKETRNGMLEVERAFAGKGLSFPAQAVAITCEGSQLDQHAQKQGWLARFPMWDWVGGRTSVMSAVGLVPMALQGVDVDALLGGAAEMDRITRLADTANNPAALLALMWHHATGGRGAKDMVMLPYKDRLLLLSRYLQQLVMESLGKELDLSGQHVHQGIAVYGNKGSTDQHAYVQQLRDGVNNFFVTFIVVLRDRVGAGAGRPPYEVDPGITSGDYLSGFWQGTREALHEKGRESVTITVERLDARSLGAVIALYERTVGFYAALVNINAYHQPGVEAGKKAAEAVLDVQRKVVAHLKQNPAPATPEELAERLGIAPQVETVHHALEHLAANRRGVVRSRGRYAWKG